jgi:hypothetical protein
MDDDENLALEDVWMMMIIVMMRILLWMMCG